MPLPWYSGQLAVPGRTHILLLFIFHYVWWLYMFVVIVNYLWLYCLEYFIWYIRTSRFTYDLQASLWVLASCCILVLYGPYISKLLHTKEVLPKFSWAIKCCLSAYYFSKLKAYASGLHIANFQCRCWCTPGKEDKAWHGRKGKRYWRSTWSGKNANSSSCLALSCFLFHRKVL